MFAYTAQRADSWAININPATVLTLTRSRVVQENTYYRRMSPDLS